MFNKSKNQDRVIRKFKIPFFITGLFFLLTSILCSCQRQHLESFFASLIFPTNYTEEYIRQNKDQVIFEIPQVYELANIAIAISQYGLEEPKKVNKESDYYQRVLEHFLPFKDHELISNPVFDDNIDSYYAFRENSACYIFKNNSIVPGGIYKKMWHPNLFEKQRKLAEDFALKSRFEEFYRDNLSYYQEQILLYKDRIPVKKMWSWLEQNFPARYDCYKIIFSPLVGESHSTQRFADGDFKEIVMFVSGPGTLENANFTKVREGLFSRVIFTEIDHNYVNPITKKYSNKVSEAFSDIDKWNKQNGYRNPERTFNEYMTWAIFSLYAYDNYEKEDFEIINEKMIKQMVNSRKFVLFEQFDMKLLELYSSREKEQKISDLYPIVLDWAEKSEQTIEK